MALKNRKDLLLIVASIIFFTLVLSAKNLFIGGLFTWWCLNTVSHNHIHNKFFKLSWPNYLFDLYLSLITSIPQFIWRHRHLAHHSKGNLKWKWDGHLGLQLLLIISFWSGLIMISPELVLKVYLPALVLGMMICHLHGYFEHYRGTISCYNRFYNLLFFNDGYHIEHHAHPQRHWSSLPFRDRASVQASSWPAPLRWIDLLVSRNS